MRSKFLFLASALILVVALSACGAAAAQTRSLSVSGTGTVNLAPDIAYVNIGVHTENADIAQAVSSNNALAQAVVTALHTSGVDAKDIQTSNFSVYTTQNYDKLTGQSTGITSFAVDNTVYITVRDLSKLGSLLDTAIKAGANNINSVSFDLSDKTAGMQQARAKAMADAGSLAAELAKSAGLSLGGIQNLSYSESSPIYSVYGMGGGGNVGVPAASAPAPINPGQIQLTATVSVTYAVK
jgi:uncharacterized protein YggE